jgi:hypothetical protein
MWKGRTVSPLTATRAAQRPLDHAALLQVLEAMKVDQARFAVIMEAYLHGVSTRKV